MSDSHSEGIFCPTYGNGYYTFTVDSYERFVREIAPQFAQSDPNFIWRGMSNPNWTLQSSMSRELAKMRASGNEWKKEATKFTIRQLLFYLQELRGLSQLTREHARLYTALLVEEKKGYLSFTNTLYNLKEYESPILELFAMGQHHHMLTPFLDWTTTPLIALYFAFNGFDERADGVGDRVVFALNKDAIEEECPPDQIPNDDWVIFMNSMAYDNPRIIGQQGLFSYVPSSEPLDRWVVNRLNFRASETPILIRFLIQNRERDKCLKALHNVGINARSVYPDLEGAALQANSRLQQELTDLNENKSASSNEP